MQKVLVGLCTLFLLLLTVILYKYSKYKREGGRFKDVVKKVFYSHPAARGREPHHETNCSDCKEKCRKRHWVRAKYSNYTKDSHPKVWDCYIDCTNGGCIVGQ